MKIGYMIVGAASALIVGATSASAAVVCNDEGDCWRVKEKVEYKPELRLRVYEDDWKWKDGENTGGVMRIAITAIGEAVAGSISTKALNEARDTSMRSV